MARDNAYRKPSPPAPDTSNIDAQIRKLHDRIEELHGEHTREKDDLRARIDELEQEKAERLDKAKREEETDAHKNTLVVPPNDIPPQQPSPPPNPPELEQSGSKRTWKNAWHGFMEDYE